MSIDLMKSSFSSAERIGLQLQQEIEELKNSKKEGWQEAAMKRVRKSRFEDPDLELSRLRAEGVITKDQEKKMDRVVQIFSNPDKMKAMLGEVLEIQKIYGATHHVLVHAQSSLWLAYPDLLKELMKLRYPEKDLHQFKFLRMPQSLGEGKGIERYSKAESVCDHESRAELISCDGYFFNNEPAESALDFLDANYNILGTSGTIQRFAKEAIQSFYPNLDASLLETVSEKISQAGKRTDHGNLFVFCIPKENSAEVQYRSHPFGQPCQCHEQQNDHKILEQLQEGDLNRETRCNYFNPQFRIYTPALKKENGIKIYLLTSDRQQRKEEKKQVQSLVQQIHESSKKTLEQLSV